MAAKKEDTKPWWAYPHLWMVLGGPAVVVVASLVTVYVAMTHQDPVIDENYYQNGLNINKVLAEKAAQAVTTTQQVDPLRIPAMTPAEDAH